MPTKDEILEKIKTALVDALGVDEDEVTPEATLVGDLGAESIDFLDIVFRLEKAFDIKIPRGELFPEDILTNSQYVKDGKVTEAGWPSSASGCPLPTSTASPRIPWCRTLPTCSPWPTCAVSWSPRCRFRVDLGCARRGPGALAVAQAVRIAKGSRIFLTVRGVSHAMVLD